MGKLILNGVPYGEGEGKNGVSSYKETILYSGDYSTIGTPLLLSEKVLKYDMILIRIRFGVDGDYYQKTVPIRTSSISFGRTAQFCEDSYISTESNYSSFISFHFPDSTHFQIDEILKRQNMISTILDIIGIKYSKHGIEYIQGAQVYSTDEKQIGVWLDGKPLYQKTWKLTTEVLLNNEGVTISAIDTSGMETLVEGCASYSITTNAKTIPLMIWKYNNTTYYASSLQTYVDIVTLYYTKTTDIAGSGGYQAYGFSPIIYSEEEREVGVWIDNKPLYAKTISKTLTAGDNVIDVGSLNIDKLVSYNGVGISSAGNVIPFLYSVSTSQYFLCSFSYPSTLYMSITNSLIAYNNAYLTIYYTKTTDVAGSGSYNTLGVPTVHYTTDEQVIGTWLDGKTLYQKTLKSNSGIAKNSWVSIINDSSIRIKNYYGFIYYSANLEDGIKYPLDWTRVSNSAYSCTECNGGDLEVIQNIATSYGYDITIQYTKTTN